ncbi:hypothetical protein DFA_09684 [Cavenderia fasciculata]|uniref:EGF-like domain-containing protein n=1 Tax=Cavenderia fasciculata TaxID=261658 RepID=F4Q8B2_CACFS|nr:uncharacterized protein DFA_09684 [Cavenderia fasciculata]EGG16012.1 hypothetical protein DFA_09684 [Cavenderia fasciculata]|eukprot:XP_004352337.1 hypothetical protein DFA_09684 [Cavenderia fasciculata]
MKFTPIIVITTFKNIKEKNKNLIQGSLDVIKITPSYKTYSTNSTTTKNQCHQAYMILVDSTTPFKPTLTAGDPSYDAFASFQMSHNYNVTRMIWTALITYQIGVYPKLIFTIGNTEGQISDNVFPPFTCIDPASIQLIMPNITSTLYTYTDLLTRKFEITPEPFDSSIWYSCSIPTPYSCYTQTIPALNSITVSVMTNYGSEIGYTDTIPIRIFNDFNPTGLTIQLPPINPSAPVDYSIVNVLQSPLATSQETYLMGYHNPTTSTATIKYSNPHQMANLCDQYRYCSPLIPTQGNPQEGMLFLSTSLSPNSFPWSFYLINTTNSASFPLLFQSSFLISIVTPASSSLISFATGNGLTELTYDNALLDYSIRMNYMDVVSIVYTVPAPFGQRVYDGIQTYTFPIVSTYTNLLVYFTQYGSNGRNVGPILPKTDIIAPKVLNVDYRKIARSYIVTLKLSDNESGVSKISFMDQTFGLSTLVAGNSTFGTFVFEIPEVAISASASNELLVIDAASNYFQPYERVYNDNMDSLPHPSIFYNQLVTADNFTYFKFIPNLVDTTDGPVPVSLLFNLTVDDNGNRRNLGLDCSFLLSTFTRNYRVLSLTTRSYYHPLDNLLRCDFTIPQYTNNITAFYNFDSSLIPLTQPYLIEKFGQQANLEIYSKNSMDHLPPYFIAYEIPTDATGDKITYSFTVSDPINGLANGSIEIRSSISPIPMIGKIVLVDNGGWESKYLEESSESASYFSPFFSVSDVIAMTTVTCTPSMNENTPPYLTSFKVSKTFIDVGSNDRTIQFNLTAADDGIGLKGYPTIYLLDRLGQSLVVEPTVKESPFFYYNYTLPHGFGVNDGNILLSVYGLRDKLDNLDGYSTLRLNSSGFVSTIRVGYSLDIPSISSVEGLYSYPTRVPVQPNNEIITIRGRGFGDNIQQLIGTIEYGNGTSLQHMITMAHHVMVFMEYNPRLAVIDRPVRVSLRRMTNNQGHAINVMPIPLLPPLLFVPTPAACAPSPTSSVNCTGNGQCTFDGCVCNRGWSGFFCESTVINVDQPIYNETSPIIDIIVKENATTVIRSVIAVVAIRELTMDGKVFQEYRPKNWTLNMTTPDNNNTNSNSNTSSIELKYHTILQQTQTLVNVTIEWFAVDSQVEFANQTISIPATSTKVSIGISAYPFDTVMNTLQVVLRTSVEANYDSECSSREYGFGEQDNLDWMKLNIDDKSLWGQFIRRGILDDRIATINNQIITDYIDSSDNDTSSSSTTNYVGLDVPYFSRYVQLDPNFVHLVNVDGDMSDSTCKTSPSGLTMGQIAGIVVGCIAGGAIAIASTIYILHKRKFIKSQKKLDLKLKRASTSESDN